MKMSIDKALSTVFEELMSMDTESFLTELEKHKDGDISQLLLHMANIEELEVFDLLFQRVISLDDIHNIKRIEFIMFQDESYSLTRESEAANDEDYVAYFMAA